MFSANVKSIIASTILTGSALICTAPDMASAQESDLAEANRAIANPLTNNVLFITESDTA